MRVIHRTIKHDSRSDVFRIIPLGDIHLGAAACDEELFKTTIKDIENDDNAYWIGLGDYADFINRRDPRFDITSQAEWLHGIGDITKVQRDRFLDIIEPIAHKCLALVEGNHETAITRHTERAIFNEIVMGVKERGGFEPDEDLGVGYYGWLRLRFERKGKGGRNIFLFNLHHGFIGGRLSGAKALNMQRWLWTHDCDIVIFGHSHNTAIYREEVVGLDRLGKPVSMPRIGCYGGTYLNTSGEGHTTYSEFKGYFPNPTGGVEIHIRPGHHEKSRAIKVLM